MTVTKGEAHARVVQVNAEAAAKQTKLEGNAEAGIVFTKGEAEAKALALRAEAYRQFNEAAVIQTVLSMLPEIVRAAAEPMANIKDLTVLSTDGASELVRNATRTVAEAGAAVKGLTGIDIPALIGAAMGGRFGDSGEGGDEGGSGSGGSGGGGAGGGRPRTSGRPPKPGGTAQVRPPPRQSRQAPRDRPRVPPGAHADHVRPAPTAPPAPAAPARRPRPGPRPPPQRTSARSSPRGDGQGRRGFSGRGKRPHRRSEPAPPTFGRRSPARRRSTPPPSDWPATCRRSRASSASARSGSANWIGRDRVRFGPCGGSPATSSASDTAR